MSEIDLWSRCDTKARTASSSRYMYDMIQLRVSCPSSSRWDSNTDVVVVVVAVCAVEKEDRGCAEEPLSLFL